MGFHDLELQVAQMMIAELSRKMGIIESMVKSTSFSIRKECRTFIPKFPSIIQEPDAKDLSYLVSQASVDLMVEFILDEITDNSETTVYKKKKRKLFKVTTSPPTKKFKKVEVKRKGDEKVSQAPKRTKQSRADSETDEGDFTLSSVYKTDFSMFTRTSGSVLSPIPSPERTKKEPAKGDLRHVTLIDVDECENRRKE